eukprot:CAMPEP_0179177176 /NCGR_PEP_ID=MMETSP0796-20121207/87617_1 /TAXON_ID=73915 /ORGANISM="Pyrodinium bahamense, Strain pbaha01" /LENGTH=222 /DNA_ID=CAMNT_0020880723 /DNA_START=69 /DNA_END=738 /DNA_ORIENTATION=-
MSKVQELYQWPDVAEQSQKTGLPKMAENAGSDRSAADAVHETGWDPVMQNLGGNWEGAGSSSDDESQPPSVHTEAESTSESEPSSIDTLNGGPDDDRTHGYAAKRLEELFKEQLAKEQRHPSRRLAALLPAGKQVPRRADVAAPGGLGDGGGSGGEPLPPGEAATAERGRLLAPTTSATPGAPAAGGEEGVGGAGRAASKFDCDVGMKVEWELVHGEALEVS